MYGEVVNVSIGGMLRLLSEYRQTGSLHVRGEGGEGVIYLKNGLLVGVQKSQADLREELLKLLLLKKGNFNFEVLEDLPVKNLQSQEDEIENLILEASRRIPSQEAADYLPGEEVVLKLAPVAGEREWVRLHLQRDEWNLLTRVNGEDSMAMVREKSGLRKGRALQIFYGLMAAGIIRKLRYRIPKLIEIATRELGNLGEALVRQAFRKLNLDQNRMHMRELIALLSELERSITLLAGPTRAQTVIDLMWEGSKH